MSPLFFHSFWFDYLRIASKVPELEILNVNCPSNTKRVIVNVQPHCNGHFCWRQEFAPPAAEV